MGRKMVCLFYFPKIALANGSIQILGFFFSVSSKMPLEF